MLPRGALHTGNAGRGKKNRPQVSGLPSTQLPPAWCCKRWVALGREEEASSAGPEGAAEQGSVRPEPALPPAAAAVGPALPGEADPAACRRAFYLRTGATTPART